MFLCKTDIEEIEMDLTGTCNLQCPLCTRNYKHAKHMIKKNIRLFKDIKKQLDEFTNLKRFFIAGAVSEPTLYPDFFAFIHYLNQRNITYELFTNGNTHNEEWWRQLGKIIPINCLVVFTVCGSTQKLHEKYRVGSNLQQILNNASAFRENGKKNDWCQHILFEYNKDDMKNMDIIFKQFSNIMKVESEGIRRLNEKIKTYSSDIMPHKKRDAEIKFIFDKRNITKDITIECKSYNEKKIYIDQFGRISACYIHPEFENDYFNSDIFDYTDICNYKYPDCYLCSTYVKKMMKIFNMEFIC